MSTRRYGPRRLDSAPFRYIDRLAGIQRLFEKANHAGDPDRAFRHNRDFHFSVYRLSGMEMLVAHIESLWVSMGPMLTVFFNEGEHKYVGAAEHKRVIEGLRDKDSAKARTAMERDLILGGEDFLRFLRTHEEFAVS